MLILVTEHVVLFSALLTLNRERRGNKRKLERSSAYYKAALFKEKGTADFK